MRLLNSIITSLVNSIANFFRAREARIALKAALEYLYAIAGGSADSGDVRAAKLHTSDRLYYFTYGGPDLNQFQCWVRAERALGRLVLWLKDMDKTQAEGDVFIHFYRWLADNDKFSPEQVEVIASYLRQLQSQDESINAVSAGTSPHDVLLLWESKSAGGPGISTVDFWKKIYWPCQVGWTHEEKQRLANEFAPVFDQYIYPDVRRENEVLSMSGVNVVLVSYGDKELLEAIAPRLGVDPVNTVGSVGIYGDDGRSEGRLLTYELFDQEWSKRPQGGKPLLLHLWLKLNLARFGLNEIDTSVIVIAGIDGDSASADGGLMILNPLPAVLGNFMVDTPGEPDRIKKFYDCFQRYGFCPPGKCFTLVQQPPSGGKKQRQ